MSELAKAAQKGPQDRAYDTVRSLVRQQQGAIEAVLPGNTDPKRFAQTVLTEVRRNPKLLQADGLSLLGAVMLGAQLRLEFGPLGHAYLLPFGKEVTFVVGYKGMIDLALRSPKTESVIARAVFDGDDFDYAYGLDEYLRHKPQRDTAEDADKLTHVYAIGRIRDGHQPLFVVLTREDVEFYRDRSPSWRAKKKNSKITTPWDTDYVAMARKTAIRRLFPFLPVSAELSEVLAVDETRVPAGQPLVTNMLEDLSENAEAIEAGADDDDDPDTVHEGEVIDPDEPEKADGEPAPEPPEDGEEW